VAATITIQSVVVEATGFGFSSFSSAVADVETAMESAFLTTTDVAAAAVVTATVAVGYGFLSFLPSLADVATTAAAKYCLRVRGFYTPEFEHIL
jgi:hypothetical protein